jgi:hypothetical protein
VKCYYHKSMSQIGYIHLRPVTPPTSTSGETSPASQVSLKGSVVLYNCACSEEFSNLYKMGPDDILRRCVMEEERPLSLAEAHEGITGVHYAGKETS